MRNRLSIVLVSFALVTAVVYLAFFGGDDTAAAVRADTVQKRDLVEVVTSSGNIRARRTVDISSDVSARVARLFVREGEDVAAGQRLLLLVPDQYDANRERMVASLAQAEAQETQQRASLLQAQSDRDRLLELRSRDSLLVSHQELENANTAVDVQESILVAAGHGVAQARAALDEADDLLSKTVFTAPISGRVTRLNVEEGETVIIGTMNNPGSLVLTISDLSVIEVLVKVDETAVSKISLGDSASVRIDAFPDRLFTGKVTEIGNSAIVPPSQQTTTQQAAIDFEVVLTLDPTDAPLRPDLSATADIVVEERSGVLSVPIIAVTVRSRDGSSGGGNQGEESSGGGSPGASSLGNGSANGAAPPDVEGVFIIENGTVTFRAVALGIAGMEHFELLTGLAEGDSIVAGPYQRIRELVDGQSILLASESGR